MSISEEMSKIPEPEPEKMNIFPEKEEQMPSRVEMVTTTHS